MGKGETAKGAARAAECAEGWHGNSKEQFVVYLRHVPLRHKADPELKKEIATLVPRVYKHGHINLMPCTGRGRSKPFPLNINVTTVVYHPQTDYLILAYQAKFYSGTGVWRMPTR